MFTPGKESYDQPRQHKKQRVYSVNKGLSSQAMVFPVVMYGCESWTIRKAECQRIGAFEVWCWRRLLRVPWTARRSNQSILEGLLTTLIGAVRSHRGTLPTFFQAQQDLNHNAVEVIHFRYFSSNIVPYCHIMF